MRNTHLIIAEMIIENRKHREEKLKHTHPFAVAKAPVPKIKISMAPVAYGSARNARLLKLKPRPPGIHQHQQHNKTLAAIGHFLALFKWELPSNAISGITWIDLVAAFRLAWYGTLLAPL